VALSASSFPGGQQSHLNASVPHGNRQGLRTRRTVHAERQRLIARRDGWNCNVELVKSGVIRCQPVILDLARDSANGYLEIRQAGRLCHKLSRWNGWRHRPKSHAIKHDLITRLCGL
jgi:hypothetical protein